MADAARRTDTPLPDVFPRYAQKNLDARQRWLGRLLRRLVPRHTFEPLRFELAMAWLRLRSRGVERRFAGAHDLLVNLGAGPRGRDGWVNVDAVPAPGVNCLYDCRRRLPFPDGSVRAIFCEHFFEHVDYTEEVPFFLAECRRVLAPGGVLRIVVPDFELYARGYLADGWSELEAVRTLGPGRHDPYVQCRYETKMELLNVVLRQGSQHKWAYDWESLRHVLERHGFSPVERSAFGESRLPELRLDAPERRPESLYVEAVR